MARKSKAEAEKEKKRFKIERLQRQLDDLKQMSDSKSKRCYLAGCSNEKIKSLCKWIDRAWYDNLNVDDATHKRLKNPLKTASGKRLVSVLADPKINDISVKRRLLLHRDCTKKLFPILFKYLIPSVRNILTETIQEMEEGSDLNYPNIKESRQKTRRYKKPRRKVGQNFMDTDD